MSMCFQFHFGKKLDMEFVNDMKRRLELTVGSKDRCSTSRDLFTKQLILQVKQHGERKSKPEKTDSGIR